MKKLFFGLSVFVLVFMFSCSDDVTTVNGTVKASYLKGVKVCLEGTNNCKTTDKDGKFEFKDLVIPATLELKIGDTLLTKVKIKDKNVKITPKVLAGDNETLASYVGALLHNIGGCSLSDNSCDLSSIQSVNISDLSDNNSLVKQIKKALQDNETLQYDIIDTDNETVNKITTKNDAEIYASINPGMIGKDNISYSAITDDGNYLHLNFDITNNTLSYTYKPNDNNNSTSQQIILNNEYKNVVFKDSDGALYFISPGFIVANIDINNDKDVVIGLQDISNKIDIKDMPDSTQYNYIEPDGKNTSLNIISIWKTSNLGGNWSDDEGDFGKWSIDNSSKYINIVNNEAAIKAFIKPSYDNGSASFILGGIDSEGDEFIGFGLEAKTLTDKDMSGTYYYYRFKEEDYETVCYGKATITSTSFSYADQYCQDDLMESYSDDFEINNPKKGMAKLKDKNAYLMVDKESGSLIFIDTESENMIIGTSNPVIDIKE